MHCAQEPENADWARVFTGAVCSAASVHRYEKEELPPTTRHFVPLSPSSLMPLLQATLPVSDLSVHLSPVTVLWTWIPCVS